MGSCETTVGSFKNEAIRRQGPWRDVNQVELATAEWVVWFNTERPHEYLDDFSPRPSRSSSTITKHPTKSGVIQRTRPADSPGEVKRMARISFLAAWVAGGCGRFRGYRAVSSTQ